MNKRMMWRRVLCVVGFAMTAIALAGLGLFWWGATSIPRWLGVSLITVAVYFPVPSSGLVVLGALLGKSRYRRLLSVAFLLTMCGLIAGVYFFAVAFNDSYDGPYPQWASYVACAYPIGAIMSCVGAVLVIVESFRSSPRVVTDSFHVTR